MKFDQCIACYNDADMQITLRTPNGKVVGAVGACMAHAGNLQQPFFAETAIKPYQCGGCWQAFATEAERNDHVKVTHND